MTCFKFVEELKRLSLVSKQIISPGNSTPILSIVCHSDSRSIRSIAPKCWNSLSSSLKDSVSIAAFKEKSKLDLLAPYHDHFMLTIKNLDENH